MTPTKLQRKYEAAVRKRDYITASRLQAQMNRQQETEQIAVRDLFSSMTDAQKLRATDLCTFIMVYADLIESASTDLQALLEKVDTTCQLLLHQQVKQLRRIANDIVKNVDSLGDDDFSESFGELCDKIALNVQNIIYTERAIAERKRKEAEARRRQIPIPM